MKLDVSLIKENLSVITKVQWKVSQERKIAVYINIDLTKIQSIICRIIETSSVNLKLGGIRLLMCTNYNGTALQTVRIGIAK